MQNARSLETGFGNCEKMQLNRTVHIEILWEGGDRVFDAGECGFGTDDRHLGARHLGTDLLWDHECDGSLFRISFVMTTFFSGILL
jgi:hypothetical protein